MANIHNVGHISIHDQFNPRVTVQLSAALDGVGLKIDAREGWYSAVALDWSGAEAVHTFLSRCLDTDEYKAWKSELLQRKASALAQGDGCGSLMEDA